MAKNNKCTIIVFSGDMDKVFAAFIIATAAAAAGMETMMFFTFWGLKAVQKGNLTGKGFFGRMLGLMNRGGVNAIGPSRFNFGGIGRWMFKKMMSAKKVAPLSTLLQTAIDLEVKLYVCQMSADVMEIKREDFIPEITGVVGAAMMVKEAAESEIHFFI
jgi:peroxiredoxin family protein